MKFLTLCLMIFLVSSVQASDCQPEAQKFCQGIDAGKGQLAKCLGDYQAQLSAACARELKHFQQMTSKKNPCFEDLTEFCVDIPTDPAKLEYCLLKNENKLSKKCSADFKQKKGNIIVKNVCAQDVVSNCYPEVSGPDGAINHCLIRNRSKLSTFCKKSVEARIDQLKKNNPCFDDTEKHCPTQLKFVDIQHCLEKKMATLNPACQKLVEAEKKKASSNPCYMDLMRHCKPGLAPVEQHRCLTLNEGELGHACRQFRKVEEEKIGKMMDLCENDRLRFCPKVPFQDGKVLECLKENKAKLTAGCSKLLN